MRGVLRFFAVARRMMLGGVVFLLIAILYQGNSLTSLISKATQLNSLVAFFSLYLVVSIIAYLILLIISTILVRTVGWSASAQKEKPWIMTFLQCGGSDFTAPFRCIGGLFSALFGKYPDIMTEDMIKASKGVSIRRFLWMVIWTVFCLVCTLVLL